MVDEFAGHAGMFSSLRSGLMRAAPFVFPPAGIRRRLWVASPLTRSIAAYLLLPNLPFAILGQFVFVTRALVNVDYLLLGSIAGLLPRGIVTVVYAILLGNDAFVSLAPVFHFNLETAVFSLTFALQNGLVLTSLGIAFAMSVSTIAVLGDRLTGARERRVARPGLLAIAVLIITLDIVGGMNGLSHADSAVLRVNVATSALYRTARAIQGGVSGAAKANGTARAPSVMAATANLRQALMSNPYAPSLGASHIVLILVESLGHFRDVDVDSVVLAPLLSESVRRRYDVRGGTVPARGATTEGEFRELCGVDANYLRVRQVDASRCLPAILRRNGFRTFAVHGYSQEFYDRYEQYPLLGFEEMQFAEDLERLPGIRMCGSTFRGVCDEDASQIVSQEIREAPRGERRFVYWMTLTSHLPVDAASAAGSSLDCRQSAEAQRFADVCALMRLQRMVASEIAAIATDPLLPPTRFVLVGDHTPPFFSREKRSLFVPDEVPFVELIPKQSQPQRPTHMTTSAGLSGR